MDFRFDIVDFILVSPALVLFLASLVPLTIKVLQKNQEPNTLVTMSYGMLGVIGAALGVFFAQQGVSKLAFEGALIFDNLGLAATLIILFAAGYTLIVSRESFATSRHQYSEFVFLLLNAVIGMLTVIWSNDLITLFVGIELMSLASYILVAHSSEERLSKEAAFKYFILGSFASAILLYGISFVYGTVGATYLPDITNQAMNLMETNRLFMFGIILLVLGLCFKVSIFPFHAWTPDVYQGAATPVTGLMATGVKVACFMFFLRVAATESFLADRADAIISVLQWLAVFTMIVGNVAALIQSNFKRMLAYSSIAHSGYIMLGLIVAASGKQNAFLGASSVGFYLVAYTLMTLGAFAFISLYEEREDTELQVSDLDGMASKNPVMAAALTVLMLSLAGIPPLIGFFAKFFVLAAAIKLGFFWLTVWAVIASIIGVYYYLRPIVGMYMKPGTSILLTSRARPMTQASIVLAAALVVITGFASDPIFQSMLEAMRSLF